MSFLTFLNIKDSSIETNPFVEKKYDNKKILLKFIKIVIGNLERVKVVQVQI